MGKQKPIYVHSEINTSMEELWKYTQSPDLHTAWDLRFTEINYLDKKPNEPQKFLYQTKIGFGLAITGTGETAGQVHKENGERISSLKFSTEHPLSLIREGRGYWKYTQTKKGIEFETQYDYETNFGKIGRIIDAYLFRPVLGWATAWSFDSLRLWIENDLHPKQSLQKTFTYWTVCFLLAFVWFYQGFVPKLIVSHPEEVNMLSATIGSSIDAIMAVQFVGIAEMLFGLIWLFPFNKRKLFIVHAGIILVLTVTAWLANPNSFIQPFNPITLNLLMIGLSIIGYANSDQLPSAKNCRRIRSRGTRD